MSDERRRRALEDWHARLHRPPRDWHECILDIDVALFERLTRLYEAYEKHRIEPKLRHLIWAAVDVVPTHLYAPGLERHVRAALAYGATAREILEVFEIASSVGERAFSAALPVVLDEIGAAGRLPAALTGRPTAEEVALRAKVMASTGAAPGWLSTLFRLSPDFARTLVDLGHGSFGAAGALDAKSRCLILLAIHSCPATLDLASVRQLSRQALDLGIAPEDLVAVLELGSGIGLHALSVGAPVLQRVQQELAAQAMTAGTANTR